MGRKEKTSLIEMLNTSIGNISGLFKKKKEGEDADKDVEVEEITASQDKETSQSFLLDDEEEFEKDISRLSVSIGEGSQECPESGQILECKGPVPLESGLADELQKLRKIIALKDEIRQKEREKDKEAGELRILESIKTQAELEYERKRRKILLQMIESLETRLEESEIQCLELMKYCNLLIEQQEKTGTDKKR
ncbi:uncharacterized protein NEMAJ01_0184 [Nematocida major]|uniref:uncharacterized protein n=1 Tax=Nematocida major TaxID=1912982 RepID=UPI002007496B|nr:uncharacterized protein NEMAJ01_0184 [Nematocida major]KAH9385288.1 hypothetical protein NEMAJ01_0184 [Nematocida major]